jgi:hypothetical protein
LLEIRTIALQMGYGCVSDPTTEKRLALRCMPFSPNPAPAIGSDPVYRLSNLTPLFAAKAS